MLISSLLYASGGQCTLTFDERDQWLRATWSGQIGPYEAKCGAANYLQKVSAFSSSRLLNDNLNLRGPWFDSLEWLEQTWLPHAQRLGLRHIAHVVQADTHTDILTLWLTQLPTSTLDLQFFDHVAEAEDWLRTLAKPG